ncbi:tRNA (adenosine(37)-N6)-threonylcarbamoyltransferase complex ATPase subunit type 1 TsaE [Candidatus Jorgensenbacteria bacterium CG10_big_fil_rev_8_21_14_0_10_54_38]|uniref:tRNA threonylcarbamoyladenosine biosynthesis protein TsaE n=2 Tax=Candidatus Joergenseniibacteriota TaxID=1752739 RepID=A0A2M6WG14_9BACT|nr:MAG: tRNA (adenosine(37)-N6)-threonylcarbamoyltransferase complex ATPase subunit type 1 TsaE [Candidatus Jorgensenbacteria bacterium CG23_combo_of_CG06-09_8_20_14_all_54_14]PIT91740.1 MAG: tRNA (adenosine(37)-N6)-threonylcarbamoyltransferase complex ATPase subunit type 1 TsaE [Candidatus Jorgensenbacteria bacterium CG10_big_fil_rev_8_21_14_0_10_54_38]
MGSLSTSQVDRLGKQTFLSRSPAETKKIAASLARRLLRRGPTRLVFLASLKQERSGNESNRVGRRATVLALVGDLGAGKTTFIQGFARGLGIKHHITSPTFVIFRNYPIPRHKLTVNSYKFFYHIDAYRIRKISELAQLGFKKILAEPNNIVLVEWAENIERALPRNTISITFSHGKKRSERKIEIRQM